MNNSDVTKQTLEFRLYDATNERPGSRGTYIARLSNANREKLKVKRWRLSRNSLPKFIGVGLSQC